MAFGLNNVGSLLVDLGIPAEALAAHIRAKLIFQKLADADPGDIAYKRNLGYSHRGIGWLLHQTGQPVQALAEFEQESPWNELANSVIPELGIHSPIARRTKPPCSWLWAGLERHAPHATGRF